MTDLSVCHQAPVFFTICSKNLLAYAKTYVDSVKKHHPESEVYIFLADRFIGPKAGLENATVVTLEEHGGTYYRDMMFKYNITEFNTSIKPFCFLYLFDRIREGTGVVYMDPDTWIHSPLVEVSDGFDAGADCVLTPHMTEPMGYSDLTDRSLLKYGAYNFGFVGISKSARNEEIVCWWADELRENCTIDYENGLFVDQKYGDLFPSFFEDSLILRHSGYNVAYWNLFSRTLYRTDAAEIYANKDPLRFLHFSGVSTSDTSPVISRHCQYLTKGSKVVYGELLAEWSKEVDLNMHEVHLDQGYSFFWNSADKGNEHTPQTTTQDSAILSFERSHWMFMNQYISIEVFRDWVHKEKKGIESLGVGINACKTLKGKSIFCNSCMNWSLAANWENEFVCPCGSDMLDRLINAFLYQELKVKTESSILIDTDEVDSIKKSPSVYISKSVAVENTMQARVVNSESAIGISIRGLDFLLQIMNDGIQRDFNTQIIGFTNLTDSDTLDSLDESMTTINELPWARASLFTGFSLNHFVNTDGVGLLYIENLLSDKTSAQSVLTEFDLKNNDLTSAA